MQRVGRQNMDSIDGWIFEQLLIISGGAVDANAVTELRAPVRSLEPATAAISTVPRRRRFSACTFPMKPVPMSAVFSIFIT